MAQNTILYWDALSSQEISTIIAEANSSAFVLIPLGVTEAHGSFMPLWFDVKIALLITHLVAERLVDDGFRPFVFDRVANFGIVGATCELPGTIPYDGLLTTRLLFQSIRGLYNHGIHNFFVINGDGGTGDQWRGLLFYATETRRKFFCEWNGSFSFITWFDGIDGEQGHASSYEHAWLRYVCHHADEHTRAFAQKLNLSAHLLTHENLTTIDGEKRIYPHPRREFISWKAIPGQESSRGVSSFSLSEYTDILESGTIARMWKQQIDMVYNRIRDALPHADT